MTGADDYITKPFSPKELLVRIKTVLRRGPLISSQGQIIVDDLVLNVDQHEVKINDEFIKLTPIEYKMLYFFSKHLNKAFSRNQLINHVWGINSYIDDRTIDVHVRRLRNKLKPHG
jgi:two-component system phosphate regulon response regulator PhoB